MVNKLPLSHRISIFRHNWKDDLARWIAWKLPRRLVMWCAIRVDAHATTGKYSNQVVSELTVIDALKRWEEHCKEEPPEKARPFMVDKDEPDFG